MNKKVLIVLLATVLVSGFATAQTTDSASLFLSGVVGEFVNITVNPRPAATNLLLNVTQGTPVEVARVIEASNTAYEVEVESSNNFAFVNGANEVAYTLHYNGTAFPAGGVVSSGSSANNLQRSVGVTYTGADATLDSGVYTDTLTFTITATN